MKKIGVLVAAALMISAFGFAQEPKTESKAKKERKEPHVTKKEEFKEHRAEKKEEKREKKQSKKNAEGTYK